MPRRIKESLEETTAPVVEQKKGRSIEVPLPKFTFPPKTYTPILIGLLLIASFLLGALTTKVQYLEKNGTKVEAATVAQPTIDPAQQQAAQPTPSGKTRAITADDHIRGNKDGKVTVMEFSDLECPFCKQFHPTMLNLVRDYGDKVRFVWRHYPLPFHQNAEKEAEGAECMNELGGQDAFWKYVDTIFERTTSNGTGFALDNLGPLASELGVDQTAFQSCLDSGKYAKHVQDDITDGNTAGVSGTPTTIIYDQSGKPNVIVGAVSEDQFKTAIDAALK